MQDFANARILITGAASGIGAAAARTLAGRGAALVLCDLDGQALAALAGSIDADTQLLAGDVADEAMWNGADLSGLTHAVVNAGIGAGGMIADLDFADWRRVMATNLDGAFLTLRAAMRAMAGRGGAIVAVSSASGIKAEPGVAAYGASKAALIQLVKVAAKEGAAQGIRVNAIAPAGVETPVWDAVPMFADRAAEIGRDEAFAEMARLATPMGRYAKPEEIAGQIAFLLSDETAYMTGGVMVSDGGYTL